MAPLRRSLRARRPSAKYNQDPLEGYASSDHTDEQSDASQRRSNVDGDDSFADSVGPDGEIHNHSDDDEFVAQPSASEEDEDLDDNGGGDDDWASDGNITSPLKAKQSGKKPSQTNELVTRAIQEIYVNSAQHLRLTYNYGAADQDIMAAVETFRRWSIETVLPSKQDLRPGKSGTHWSYFTTDEQRQRETIVGWKWYEVEGGQEHIASKQSIIELTTNETQRYVSHLRATNFVLGPVQNQKAFALNLDESLALDEGFRTSSDVLQSDDEHPTNPDARLGWIIDAGAKVQAMQWLPYQDDDWEYLAFSTMTPVQQPQSTRGQNWEVPYSPAFDPMPSCPSALQIWAYPAKLTDNGVSYMDLSRQPRPAIRICSDWGDVRDFKFCHIERRDENLEEIASKQPLLLAMITQDGTLRIFDISLPGDSPYRTVYLQLKAAAFELRPPHALCTSLTWLSPTSISAACTNGFVVIWHLPTTSAVSPGHSPEGHERHEAATPVYYRPQHNTYIKGLVSAYPSRPHFLATMSMNGYLRLSDLRSPLQDTLVSQRMRVAPSSIAWYEPIQSFLLADDTISLRALSARRFFIHTFIGRTNAPQSSVGTSFWHASVLFGGSDGTVSIWNPFMKTQGGRNVDVWSQTWFVSEWRRGRKDLDRFDAPSPRAEASSPRGNMSSDETSGAEAGNMGLLTEPMVRFLDGFKPEKLPLSKTSGSAPNSQSGTIYEEQSAVTASCWNQNRRCATWAAAGLASGLIRVEDLASDLYDR